MNISLIDHSKEYSVSNVEIGLSMTLFLGSGVVYGKRHFQLANRPNASPWHRVIACIECVPVLGGIVALIEWALFRCGCFKRIPQELPIVKIQHQLNPTPSLNKELYIGLLTDKEGEVLPYKRHQQATFQAKWKRENTFFEKVQYAKTTEEFITGLRSLNLPESQRNQEGQRITWADLSFSSRPVLFWAIFQQKLPFIESIIQSEEGAKLLNRSYQAQTGHYEAAASRVGALYLLEYPIHQAVRMADIGRPSNTTEEEAHLKDLTARRIVLRLLELNANVNQADGVGRTPLHIAIQISHFPLAKLLINQGGTVRFTPLPGQMLQVLEQDKLQELAQLHHDLDKEMHREIMTSIPLYPALSNIVLRYVN